MYLVPFLSNAKLGEGEGTLHGLLRSMAYCALYYKISVQLVSYIYISVPKIMVFEEFEPMLIFRKRDVP